MKVSACFLQRPGSVFFAEGCPKLGHREPYLSFKTLNLIAQLLSRLQNPIVLQNPKPQFVSMKLPPHPVLENTNPNFSLITLNLHWDQGFRV